MIDAGDEVAKDSMRVIGNLSKEIYRLLRDWLRDWRQRDPNNNLVESVKTAISEKTSAIKDNIAERFNDEGIYAAEWVPAENVESLFQAVEERTLYFRNKQELNTFKRELESISVKAYNDPAMLPNFHDPNSINSEIAPRDKILSVARGDTRDAQYGCYRLWTDVAPSEYTSAEIAEKARHLYSPEAAHARLIQSVGSKAVKDWGKQNPLAPVMNFKPGDKANNIFEVTTVSWDPDCELVQNWLSERGVQFATENLDGAVRFEVPPAHVAAASEVLDALSENVNNFTPSRVSWVKSEQANTPGVSLEDVPTQSKVLTSTIKGQEAIETIARTLEDYQVEYDLVFEDQTEEVGTFTVNAESLDNLPADDLLETTVLTNAQNVVAERGTRGQSKTTSKPMKSQAYANPHAQERAAASRTQDYNRVEKQARERAQQQNHQRSQEREYRQNRSR